MSLRCSYTLIAPFYDAAIRRATSKIRAQSLKHLPNEGRLRILVNGIGTGLDLPYLPRTHDYVGLDLTAAMLRRTRSRSGNLQIHLVQGNSLNLPFADNCFDHVVLHLILAVVSDPVQCLKETIRVLKTGGQILLLDKFLRRNERAWFRRALNPLAARIATRLDVVFEDALKSVSGLKVESDVPVLARGWFRNILLVKI
ncbi:MAG TPA: class I SAM-dependent methyltransferase [Burkholderiales bacterium]|nr:class I SAM-dependent methyltransferase [Burkholderiales bacterium]